MSTQFSAPKNFPGLEPQPARARELRATRDGFGDALLELGEIDPRVVVLTADLADSTRVLPFAKQFPKRFFEIGIAEQNMMGVAAGLALSGEVPFVASFGVFNPGRNWDQLRVSVCFSQANVKIAGAHTGVSIGPDGATHQALEDLAITRVLPNLTVVVPCDYWETKKATLAGAAMTGPYYLRFGREKVPMLTSEDAPFVIGQAYVMRPGTDVTIIGCGSLLGEALEAAELLAQEHISVEVINSHTIKPLDTATLFSSLRKTGAAVTIEEHQRSGGLGSAVAESLMEHDVFVPLHRLGMPDTFGQSGQPAELLEYYGMTRSHIIAAIKQVLERKKRLR